MELQASGDFQQLGITSQKKGRFVIQELEEENNKINSPLRKKYSFDSKKIFFSYIAYDDNQKQGRHSIKNNNFQNAKNQSLNNKNLSNEKNQTWKESFEKVGKIGKNFTGKISENEKNYFNNEENFTTSKDLSIKTYVVNMEENDFYFVDFELVWEKFIEENHVNLHNELDKKIFIYNQCHTEKSYNRRSNSIYMTNTNNKKSLEDYKKAKVFQDKDISTTTLKKFYRHNSEIKGLRSFSDGLKLFLPWAQKHMSDDKSNIYRRFRNTYCSSFGKKMIDFGKEKKQVKSAFSNKNLELKKITYKSEMENIDYIEENSNIEEKKNRKSKMQVGEFNNTDEGGKNYKIIEKFSKFKSGEFYYGINIDFISSENTSHGNSLKKISNENCEMKKIKEKNSCNSEKLNLEVINKKMMDYEMVYLSQFDEIENSINKAEKLNKIYSDLNLKSKSFNINKRDVNNLYAQSEKTIECVNIDYLIMKGKEENFVKKENKDILKNFIEDNNQLGYRKSPEYKIKINGEKHIDLCKKSSDYLSSEKDNIFSNDENLKKIYSWDFLRKDREIEKLSPDTKRRNFNNLRESLYFQKFSDSKNRDDSKKYKITSLYRKKINNDLDIFEDDQFNNSFSSINTPKSKFLIKRKSNKFSDPFYMNDRKVAKIFANCKFDKDLNYMNQTKGMSQMQKFKSHKVIKIQRNMHKSRNLPKINFIKSVQKSFVEDEKQKMDNILKNRIKSADKKLINHRVKREEIEKITFEILPVKIGTEDNVDENIIIFDIINEISFNIIGDCESNVKNLKQTDQICKNCKMNYYINFDKN